MHRKFNHAISFEQIFVIDTKYAYIELQIIIIILYYLYYFIFVIVIALFLLRNTFKLEIEIEVANLRAARFLTSNFASTVFNLFFLVCTPVRGKNKKKKKKIDTFFPTCSQ